MRKKPGIVYLVGAGPGDAGLITVRGVECIEQADVVVYDYLANPALLQHAKPDVERIFVGKKAGDHTATQDEICAVLAERAEAGLVVTRLKGGDPFVFGRGGEEAVYLAERDIPFEVVPGVTSAVAVPAYAGIPITQRHLNVSFHVITGHEDPDKGELEVEWDVLARAEGTLVFMMGIGNLPKIVSELTARGRSPETPVALIRWGTMPEQETLVSTLSKVVQDVKKHNFTPPAVTVIGPVVELRKMIAWAEKRPLFGVRAAVTRPREQSLDLVKALRAAGADVVITPTIRIEPRPLTEPMRKIIGKLSSYAWVIFTSPNAVRVFMDYLFEMNLDARALAESDVAAIGEKTAQALLDRGIRADVVPRESVQEGLAGSLKLVPGQRILIPRAAAARDVLEDETTRRGAKVTVLPVYDTIPDNSGISDLKRELTRGRVNLVTFTSSSTIEKFAETVKEEDLPKLFEDVSIAAIGKVTAETLERLGLKSSIVSEKATSNALAESIIRHYRDQKKKQNETSQVFRGNKR